eukprot:5705994-Pyramimonas_sp.AAC.1
MHGSTIRCGEPHCPGGAISVPQAKASVGSPGRTLFALSCAFRPHSGHEKLSHPQSDIEPQSSEPPPVPQSDDSEPQSEQPPAQSDVFNDIELIDELFSTTVRREGDECLSDLRYVLGRLKNVKS